MTMRHRLVLAIFAPWLLAASAVAQEPGLNIELNKIEDSGGPCSATFVLQNDTGETLDQLRFDIYVFDRDGVVSRRVFLDTGPLRDGKTSVAGFAISDRPCAEIGRLLVNDVPECRSRTGAAVDCVGLLKPSSRAAIELAK